MGGWMMHGEEKDRVGGWVGGWLGGFFTLLALPLSTRPTYSRRRRREGGCVVGG